MRLYRNSISANSDTLGAMPGRQDIFGVDLYGTGVEEGITDIFHYDEQRQRAGSETTA